MRIVALVGLLVLVSSGAAARPGADSNNPVPLGSPPLVIPSGLISEDPPGALVPDSAPVLDDSNTGDLTGGPFSSGTSSQRAVQHHYDSFQSGGIRFNVANLKIFGGQIGGNGVYRGAVATLNWNY